MFKHLVWANQSIKSAFLLLRVEDSSEVPSIVKNLWFFSRDKRTHGLFRTSWHQAAEALGARVQVVCRDFGLWNTLLALGGFIGASRYRRVIFGTSEICLYSAFSRKQDIWVFTGLGRLLIDDGLTSRVVCRLLRLMYRDQMLVVLNEADRDVLHRVIGGSPVLLEGEGYTFHPQTTRRPERQGLTFAYVGRLLKSKGVDRLVESFARHSRPDWTLLLIGDSDFSNRDSVSTKEVKRLTHLSQGKIVSTGFQPDVRSLLLEVDVLVSLSRREGLPFAVLDGVQAGTHLVLSPVPGHLSFDGLPGVTYVEPSNLGIFFEQISNNPTSFLKFDRAARLALCEQRFGMATTIVSIKALLSELTESSRRG